LQGSSSEDEGPETVSEAPQLKQYLQGFVGQQLKDIPSRSNRLSDGWQTKWPDIYRTIPSPMRAKLVEGRSTYDGAAWVLAGSKVYFWIPDLFFEAQMKQAFDGKALPPCVNCESNKNVRVESIMKVPRRAVGTSHVDYFVSRIYRCINCKGKWCGQHGAVGQIPYTSRNSLAVGGHWLSAWS
jgi:hypothetical protein